jgi:hypothetical protein
MQSRRCQYPCSRTSQPKAANISSGPTRRTPSRMRISPSLAPGWRSLIPAVAKASHCFVNVATMCAFSAGVIPRRRAMTCAWTSGSVSGENGRTDTDGQAIDPERRWDGRPRGHPPHRVFSTTSGCLRRSMTQDQPAWPCHDEPCHDAPCHDEPCHDEPCHDEPCQLTARVCRSVVALAVVAETLASGYASHV